MRSLRSKHTWVVGCMIAVISSISYGTILNPLDDDGRWGFEIGNGKLVQNLAGKYGINVPDRWESFIYERFTEVAPQLQGGPRSSLQINVIGSHGIRTTRELISQKLEGDWSMVSLRGLEGIKREDVGKHGFRKVAIELCRGDELVLINLQGQLEHTKHSAFDQLYNSLQTIQIEN